MHRRVPADAQLSLACSSGVTLPKSAAISAAPSVAACAAPGGSKQVQEVWAKVHTSRVRSMSKSLRDAEVMFSDGMLRGPERGKSDHAESVWGSSNDAFSAFAL
jgi:hypothetical protein